MFVPALIVEADRVSEDWETKTDIQATTKKPRNCSWEKRQVRGYKIRYL